MIKAMLLMLMSSFLVAVEDRVVINVIGSGVKTAEFVEGKIRSEFNENPSAAVLKVNREICGYKILGEYLNDLIGNGGFIDGYEIYLNQSSRFRDEVFGSNEFVSIDGLSESSSSCIISKSICLSGIS
jgi:hypothetical protein